MKRKKKCFTETRGEGEKSDVGEAAGGRSVLLPFTNVFISSFFTLMWLTVVLCSAAGSSTPSSSSSSSSSSLSSSSKGFEPAGAVLLGTVKLTTWGGEGHSEKWVVYMHTLHTQIHTETPAGGEKNVSQSTHSNGDGTPGAVYSSLVVTSLTNICVLSPLRRKKKNI